MELFLGILGMIAMIIALAAFFIFGGYLCYRLMKFLFDKFDETSNI